MTTTTWLGITKLDPGQSAAHVRVNEALDALDKAIAGLLSIDLTGITSKTLTGAESTNQILLISATDGACDLEVQAVPKTWTVVNDGSHTVTVKVSAQIGAPTVAAGSSAILFCDGVAVRAIP